MGRLPLKDNDFIRIRENRDYFVDKTGFIMDIVANSGIKAFLFMRPSGFGKSLNLDMLDAFFGINHADNGWFDGLKVSSDEESMLKRNSYPVISLSLKALKTDGFDEFLSDFGSRLSDVCRRYTYLLEWETKSNRKAAFIELMNGTSDEAILRSSLLTLSEILYEYHGRKTIVLIDDYDDAINDSFGKPAHREILGFVKGLLSNVLKSNDNLRFGVVTGIMQVSEESLFPDLNNLYMNTIFNKDFDEDFGFTENEVNEILEHHGHPKKMEEIRGRYGGYRFGDADMYNSRSILNYIRNGFEMDPHCSDEVELKMILKSVRMNGLFAIRIIKDLFKNKAVVSEIDRNMMITELGDIESLLSLLVGSGYLKAIPIGDGSYELSIVNNEMRNGLLKQLISD